MLDFVFFIVYVAFAWQLARHDILERRLPNRLTTSFSVASLLRLALLQEPIGMRLLTIVFTALAVFTLGVVSYLGYRRGKIWLGMGDVKLTVALGFWFSSSLIPLYLLGCLCAACVLIARRFFRLTPERTLPFAPFLLGSGLLLELHHVVDAFTLL